MKHAGLLAHSPDGAALCFTEYCHEGQRHFGQALHPDITLDYIAMGKSMPAWDMGDYESIRKTLATSVDRLRLAGADFFFCPDNTAHIALETPGPPLSLPGLNIADVVAEEAKRLNMMKVGILGTKYTMNGPVYKRALRAQGISFTIPEKFDHAELNRVIFEELVVGITLEASRQIYLRVISDLQRDGCDGVALVCTEIPLLISQDSSPLPLLNSTRLLAQAAFDCATGKTPMPVWTGGSIP